MATRDQIRIDEDRLATELLKDPSQNVPTLAKKCGLSKQKAWRIVRKLEESGAILSYPSNLNMKNIGKRSFLILFERSSKMVDDNLIEQLTMPDITVELEREGIQAVVEDSYILNGVYDWAIVITVSEHKDLIKFLEYWRKYYGEYYARVTQSEIMWVAKRNGAINTNFSEITSLMR